MSEAPTHGMFVWSGDNRLENLVQRFEDSVRPLERQNLAHMLARIEELIRRQERKKRNLDVAAAIVLCLAVVGAAEVCLQVFRFVSQWLTV